MKARKGDVVLIERTTVDWILTIGRRERTTYEFGKVASATRDGMVKTWWSVGWGEGELVSTSAQPIRTSDHVYVLEASSIDVDGLLGAAKAHHWPGHPGQPKPFDTLDEARACARDFRKSAVA